jgi:hypothetical protein
VDTFEQELAALGFAPAGISRRGGRMWTLPFNRHLTFAVHDAGDTGSGGAADHQVLVTWTFALGEHLLERGWQTSMTDESAVELYPATDVLVARDLDAVGGELSRVLASLRLDLGAPDL